MEIVRELCSFEGRLTGTDAERRAANRLAERLRGLGRRAEIEPIHVHPQWPLVQAAHCLLAFAGSLVAIEVPALGFGLVLLAATSMYLDLNYRLYLVRRLFFRRASQNVVSPGPNPDAGARLLICAHVDAARSGAVFAPRRALRGARIAESSPVPLGPFRILFWSLALLLPLLGARMAGLDSNAIAVIQLLPTLVLLLGIFALVEIEVSEVVPAPTTMPRASPPRSRSPPSSRRTRRATSTSGSCSTAARSASRRGCAPSSAATAASSTAAAPSSSPSSRSARVTSASRPAPDGWSAMRWIAG